MVTKIPLIRGTIREIKYGFAWLPRWTDDVGWVRWTTYQVLVWEVVVNGVRLTERCTIGHYLHRFTRGWATRHAVRDDFKACMDYEPKGQR